MVPISNIVGVNISLAASPAALKGFGQLLFVTDETGSMTERVKSYASLKDVEEDWQSGTEVHAGASAYYSQRPQPTTFMVGIATSENTAAYLSGGPHKTLTDIQAITAGGFSVVIDGTLQALTGLDFSSASDMDAVAGVVNAVLTGSILAHDGNIFRVVSDTTGAVSSVSYATLDIAGAADALGLLVTNGGTIVEALDPETPVEALPKIADVNPGFYGITLNKKWRDSVFAEDVADWAEANTKVFFNTTNNAAVLGSGTDDIASKLQTKSLTRTLTSYCSTPAVYISCSVAGRAFTVNFEGSNTTITLFLKSMPTIPAETMTVSQKNNMTNKNANAFINVGGNNVYSDSRMASGHWFDTIHGVDWLQNRIETDVFNLLMQTSTKIPYTDAGVTILRQRVESGLRQGVTNGLIAPGVITDTNEHLPMGYAISVIPVSEVSASDKGGRHYGGISFRAVGAGAIHSVQINGTFSE